MLEYLNPEDSEGGEAAQTGSLVHAGVAEFRDKKIWGVMSLLKKLKRGK